MAEVTEEQWRKIAVIALADLQALGMPVEKYEHVEPVKEEVLKEVDRYMWDRNNYS